MGLLGVLATLLAIKHGKHKPSPDLRFIPEDIKFRKLTSDGYLLKVFGYVHNVGDKAAEITDIRINGCSPVKERTPEQFDIAKHVVPPVKHKRMLWINSFLHDIKPSFILAGRDAKEKLAIFITMPVLSKDVRLEVFVKGSNKPFEFINGNIEELSQSTEW